jgi:hypothetical protein
MSAKKDCTKGARVPVLAKKDGTNGAGGGGSTRVPMSA